jgi:hypothetical protein
MRVRESVDNEVELGRREGQRGVVRGEGESDRTNGENSLGRVQICLCRPPD